HILGLASLGLIPTARLPARGVPTDRKGLIGFLVMLNSYCHNHCFDPSDNRRGSVVLSQHGLDRVVERLCNEDILLRHGEDILVSYLGLQDFFADAPTPFD